MARKGSGGKGGEGGSSHVIEYTPTTGFNIKHMAAQFAGWMEETGLPLLLHLKHVSVEFEPGCTPKEIIDGYNLAMEHRMRVPHSNSNDKPAPKPMR